MQDEPTYVTVWEPKTALDEEGATPVTGMRMRWFSFCRYLSFKQKNLTLFVTQEHPANGTETTRRVRFSPFGIDTLGCGSIALRKIKTKIMAIVPQTVEVSSFLWNY